jgi:hypothetical protein
MQILVNSDSNTGVAQSPSILNNINQRLSSSMSFNSDVKDRLSDVLSDLEQDLNSSRNNIAAITTNNNFILNKDIQANNNIFQAATINVSHPSTPILLTPNAFSNSQK